MQKKLLISALEPSANLHLEPILRGLRDIQICGIFDKKFGLPLYPSDEFSVMGIVDVIPKIFKAKEAILELSYLSKDSDVALLIDSPAFNIPLAKAIKRKNPNIKIIYYILPKVWIWKKNRVKEVEKYCDVIASIFPFESQFYPNSKYVGNPLLDQIKSIKNRDKTYNQVAFLPGSRKSEIKSLMPIFKEVAKHIDAKKILVIPPFFTKEQIKSLYKDIDDFQIVRDSHEALLMSDFAFICSGTATLEAALIGTPFVLAYKAKKIDFFLAKIFIKLKYAGLANIIMDFEKREKLHTELLQNGVNVSNLLSEYQNYNKEKFYQSALVLREILQHGSAQNIINEIFDIL